MVVAMRAGSSVWEEKWLKKLNCRLGQFVLAAHDRCRVASKSSLFSFARSTTSLGSPANLAT
eukprot:EC836206.1.p6 GENE.EC836206.1~~EC836206.1.p6  ORF type:complete len:62 (-),score=0.08 EC836206.1:311-496(-)